MGNRTIRDFEENATLQTVIEKTMHERYYVPVNELRWIPISEKLPEEGQMVLACRHSDYYPWVDTVFFAEGMFFDIEFEWAEQTSEYDAWMFMPLPPVYAQETQP